MPLFSKEVHSNYTLGLWKIDEDELFFKEKLEGYPEIASEKRRLQWLASRYLANILLGQPDQIVKNEAGKPNFKNTVAHISISHSPAYAAVLISRTHAVGVDVESINPKIERIAHKFLEEHELNAIDGPERIKKLMLIWSAKESLFKLYGWGGVDFKKQLLIPPFSMQTEGSFAAGIATTQLPLPGLTVHYRFFDTQVLTWVTTG